LCKLLSISQFKCHVFCSHPIFCPVRFTLGCKTGTLKAACPRLANKPSSLIPWSVNSYQVIFCYIQVCLILQTLDLICTHLSLRDLHFGYNKQLHTYSPIRTSHLPNLSAHLILIIQNQLCSWNLHLIYKYLLSQTWLPNKWKWLLTGVNS
jgi:hypothetical protein